MAFRRQFFNDSPYYRSDIQNSPNFRNDSFALRTGPPQNPLDLNRGPGYLGISFNDHKMTPEPKYVNNFGSYSAIRKDPPMFSGFEAKRPLFSSGPGGYPDSGPFLEEQSNKRFKQNFQPSTPRQYVNKGPVPATQQRNQGGTKPTLDKPKPPPPSAEKLQSLEKSGLLPTPDSNGNSFHCYYCDAFCNSLITAECHIDSPKHKKHMTEPNEKLQGIDMKFVMKTDKITDVSVLKARKEELKRLTDEQKTKYVEQQVRLKNGIGGEAYYCLLCNSPLNSTKVIDPHITSLRHIAFYETHKAEVEKAEKEKEEEAKKDKLDGPASDKVTLDEQLKLVKVSVIGLEEIVEYIDPENEDMRLYECTLCKVFNNAATVVNHVIGFKHRVNYIKKARPLEAWSFSERTRETMALAQSKAKEIEEADGRKRWTVKNEKPKIPANVSVSPTKKVNLKEIHEQVTQPESNGPSVLDTFTSYKIENDSDAQKAVEVVNSLIDSLLKYKLSKFPAEMRTVLASKLINEGIKTSLDKPLVNGVGDSEESNQDNSQKETPITKE
ncbi:uncharacterized protein LOC107366501 [Tetranychus urticae]|uniref:U1-type domain-containing protein n=1 Tax=Tetranychus urticae TaxID=32264 RepID=T1JU18_TETUR|nr:uncharacterized protein LOC107366501 [Tetranychus urticae]